MDRLGIAIVGASMRSSMMATYLNEYPEQGYVTGYYDLIPQRAELLIDKHELKDTVIYPSLKAAVTDPKVSAVFIGTSDSAHRRPVVEALKAGKHVFCEKPMAITLRDCDAIMAAATAAHSVFYLGMNLRHGPVHEKLHEIMTSGELGRILTIEANEYYVGGRTYFRRWNRLRKFGGGLWITKACHDFDLLNWMAGADPQTVYATASLSHYRPRADAAQQCRHCKLQFSCPDYYDILNLPKPHDDLMRGLRLIAEEHGEEPGDLCLFNAEKDTFDNGIAVVTYANDIRATYTVNVLTARSTRQMRVVGTEGMIEADMSDGKILVTERHTGRQWHYDMRGLMASGHGGADDRLVKDFIHTVHTGKKPRTGWAEGKRAIEVALAAQQSMETGQVVRF